ncbi:MAG: type II toxin-antitoxin system RelE/ParE family toxin [Enhydrobacter sp.]|nr:MAG: type II toxin-antitoxin system RelE/ParE family toxin [Enhydrobacter sp.]
MKRVPAVFFRTAGGREPVREWLRGLPPEDRKAIGDDIRAVEFGWPLGMPLVRSLGDGLHEVRTRLPSRRIARVIFFVSRRGSLVLSHGFIKKTQKLPAADMALARANRTRYLESEG